VWNNQVFPLASPAIRFPTHTLTQITSYPDAYIGVMPTIHNPFHNLILPVTAFIAGYIEDCSGFYQPTHHICTQAAILTYANKQIGWEIISTEENQTFTTISYYPQASSSGKYSKSEQLCIIISVLAFSYSTGVHFPHFIWPRCSRNHWRIEEKDESKLIKGFSL